MRHELAWPLVPTLVNAALRHVLARTFPRSKYVNSPKIKIRVIYHFFLKFLCAAHKNIKMTLARTSNPLVKVNSTWSLTASTLLHPLVILSVCFIYTMSGCYSTNWDRKGWLGSEIQMYYGCPCLIKIRTTSIFCAFMCFQVQRFNSLKVFFSFVKVVFLIWACGKVVFPIWACGKDSSLLVEI